MTDAVEVALEIRIVCKAPGAAHEKRGATNLETYRRLSAPGLDGRQWRTVDVERRARGKADLHVQVFGTTRPSGEVVVLPDGTTLTGARRGRTRTVTAAVSGFDVDHGGTGDVETPTAEALAYVDMLRRSRTSVTFRCRLCGQVVRARGERIDDLLNVAERMGKREITLQEVDNFLRRQKRT
ncbi:hypothetical protein [uncultured Micrococcus sp.]|uniref:hypothetical protein n=1 Tax=uncultured Micrococcus sp. TaxID=114051 RepID=UPI00261755E2|nr:hypothetical protein [uncultured Micrococcus sp.]